MYFDTTDDKLKLHDGVSYKDSNYAGEVTNEYSSFGNLNTPSAYGTKLRNIYSYRFCLPPFPPKLQCWRESLRARTKNKILATASTLH